MQRTEMLALATLLACGGGSAGPALEPRTEQCSGNAYVAVTNDWTRTVELYVHTPGGSVTGTLLGSVLPGSVAEFPLPAEATGVRAALPGMTDPLDLPARARRFVRLRYLCR